MSPTISFLIKTVGLKLLNVMCDDHITGVTAEPNDTSHGTHIVGGALQIKDMAGHGYCGHGHKSWGIFQVSVSKAKAGQCQTLNQSSGSVQSTNTAWMYTLGVCRVGQSAANFLLSRILPVLQLIKASVGGPPNTGTLLSLLPLHQFIMDQGFLGKFSDIQQLYYFVNNLLKGEEETKWNRFIFSHWIKKNWVKQSKYPFISMGALSQVVIKKNLFLYSELQVHYLQSVTKATCYFRKQITTFLLLSSIKYIFWSNICSCFWSFFATPLVSCSVNWERQQRNLTTRGDKASKSQGPHKFLRNTAQLPSGDRSNFGLPQLILSKRKIS